MLPALALAIALQTAELDEETREALARIEAVARHAVETDGVPGLAIAVMRGSEVLLTKGWGYGDIEHHVPASETTLFPIGTVGRQLTTAAVLRLAEEQKLTLEDELERWLPGVANPGSGIRLKHLLAGTSGIPGPGAWAKQNPELIGKLATTDEFLALLRGLAPEFAPGTGFSLESSGYALLAIVVSKASGESYTDYVTREVCEPLGLENMQVCPPERRAIGFARDCEHAAEEGECDLPLSAESTRFGQHWCASVADLLRLERGLLDRSLLEEQSIRLMTTPVELPGERSTGHGYALAIETIEGLRVFSHTGGSGGFRVRTAHYVEPNVTIAILANCNSAAVESVENEVARAILGLPPRAIVEVPIEPERLARYVGTYQLATTRIRISVADGRLRFEGPETAFALLYQGRHAFASAVEKDAWITFQLEEERAVSFTLSRSGYESNARRIE